MFLIDRNFAFSMLALVLFPSAILCAEEEFGNDSIPEVFSYDSVDKYLSTKQAARHKIPKFRYALGMQADLPDLLPLDLHLFWGKYLGLRLFYTYPITFDVKVEMPDDLIVVKNSIRIGHPAYDINLKATWGPQYGAEAMYFPFANAFFVSGGISHRELRLKGSAFSPLVVSAVSDPTAAITTATVFGAYIDSQTSATLARTKIGWMWKGDSMYFSVNAGYYRPYDISRSASTSVTVDSPGNEDELVAEALVELKAQKKVEMDEKAVTEIASTDQKQSFMAGVGLGFFF